MKHVVVVTMSNRNDEVNSQAEKLNKNKREVLQRGSTVAWTFYVSTTWRGTCGHPNLNTHTIRSTKIQYHTHTHSTQVHTNARNHTDRHVPAHTPAEGHSELERCNGCVLDQWEWSIKRGQKGKSAKGEMEGSATTVSVVVPPCWSL